MTVPGITAQQGQFKIQDSSVLPKVDSLGQLIQHVLQGFGWQIGCGKSQLAATPPKP